MTKQEPEQTTRDRILEAAVAEIAEKGIGGIRTRGIAERAGVNSALVHYHFKSMDDLLAEATASVFTGLAEMSVASLTTSTVAEGLEAVADMIATIDTTEPGWQVLLEVMLHAPRDPRLGGFVMGWLREYRVAMKDRLDQAVESGEIRADIDTNGLSLALMALFDGLGLYGYVDHEFDIAAAAKSVISLITHPHEGEPT